MLSLLTDDQSANTNGGCEYANDEKVKSLVKENWGLWRQGIESTQADFTELVKQGQFLVSTDDGDKTDDHTMATEAYFRALDLHTANVLPLESRSHSHIGSPENYGLDEPGEVLTNPASAVLDLSEAVKSLNTNALSVADKYPDFSAAVSSYATKIESLIPCGAKATLNACGLILGTVFDPADGNTMLQSEQQHLAMSALLWAATEPRSLDPSDNAFNIFKTDLETKERLMVPSSLHQIHSDTSDAVEKDYLEWYTKKLEQRQESFSTKDTSPSALIGSPS